MLQDLLFWFGVYVLSFIVSDFNLGFSGQGDAFVTIWIIVCFVMTIVSVVGVLKASAEDYDIHYGMSVCLTIVASIAPMLLLLLVSLIVSNFLLNVSFYVAFELLSLGKCLIFDLPFYDPD